jgi:hypothetical protein
MFSVAYRSRHCPELQEVSFYAVVSWPVTEISVAGWCLASGKRILAAERRKRGGKETFVRWTRTLFIRMITKFHQQGFLLKLFGEHDSKGRGTVMIAVGLVLNPLWVSAPRALRFKFRI